MGDVTGLDATYARDPDFVSRRIADEVIVLPIRKNLGDLDSIYTLNDVGARIWELLDGRRSLREIRDVIVSEYQVTAQMATVDLETFVEHLTAIGALATFFFNDSATTEIYTLSLHDQLRPGLH